ncbi:peptidoglycan editing factor PgeF [Lysobacter sp. KIS68-7]|uniref:peptidoglycan editing factor PgeF n=1 Tax=Lysobacter sp. KIS68-7 TaxID=2904252 RepID=UPI001E32C90F|nr:peptidoglycan editing factor PgeF [Lysobacter sp. KIS68-7]UHQ19904.1 peptidoglycan editing factor PgeF [Lysobacter sp. KIS68-7]
MSEAVLRAEWPAPGGVQAFTTLRHGAGRSIVPFDAFNLGLRSGDDLDAVARNRAELIERFALPSAPRWLRQVHGTHVAIEPGHDEPEADAAVTRTPGTVLAILTADCMPVVFASRDGDELGAAHAGWRGLAGGVLEATLDAMRTPREHIVAWLGPAAGPQSYEIGREVYDAFVSHASAAAAAFVPTREGHWRVDLYALARQRLARAGVMDVHGGAFDTIGDARFFSHRRDQRTGRMATIAWMAP